MIILLVPAIQYIALWSISSEKLFFKNNFICRSDNSDLYFYFYKSFLLFYLFYKYFTEIIEMKRDACCFFYLSADNGYIIGALMEELHWHRC